MVFSSELHVERVEKPTDGNEGHGLDGLLEIVHRDMCKDEFLLERKTSGEEGGMDYSKEGDGRGIPWGRCYILRTSSTLVRLCVSRLTVFRSLTVAFQFLL